jgi:hypothetical protein
VTGTKGTSINSIDLDVNGVCMVHRGGQGQGCTHSDHWIIMDDAGQFLCVVEMTSAPQNGKCRCEPLHDAHQSRSLQTAWRKKERMLQGDGRRAIRAHSRAQNNVCRSRRCRRRMQECMREECERFYATPFKFNTTPCTVPCTSSPRHMPWPALARCF